MTPILCDSDVLIEHLRGNVAVHRALRTLVESRVLLVYTAISEAEIVHGMRPSEEERVRLTLSTFECLEITQAIGRRAGLYLRRYAKSHGMDVADALIAAAAAEHNYALCTFNWKHYPMTDLQRHRLLR
ncbi:MAG: PIN domain-containing protein [Deltaproteobacteria bacterium]|nr:PIN domain-containing protein [Deltaproteobacteria bacterium]